MKVKERVKNHLMEKLSFSDLYAKWLTDHLQHLKGGSLDILSDLIPKQFEHVRYATVVSIRKTSERKTFDLNIELIEKHLTRAKRNILESAVLASQENSTVMSLSNFREIVAKAIE